MVELYLLTSAARVATAILCLMALILQTMITILLTTQNQGKKNLLPVLYEASLIFFFGINVFICGVTQMQIGDAAYFPISEWLRYVTFLPVVMSVCLFLRHPHIKNGFNIILLAVLLPFFDDMTSSYYAYLFIGSNLILFLMGLWKACYAWRFVSERLSALSVKEAFDMLPDGLLFANDKGHTLLMNNTMNRLLLRLGVNPILSVDKLFHALQSLSSCNEYERINVNENVLVRLRNEGTYLFSINKIVSDRPLIQLLAADVTEEDVLTKELTNYTAELERTQKTLLQTLDNIEAIERQKELLQLKSNVHDVIGQRLSIVHRFLEDMDEGRLSIEGLRSLLYGLEDELKAAFTTEPITTFSSIQRAFELIGVSIRLNGVLPKNQVISDVLVQIVREAATNAVRHGNAKSICVSISETYLSLSVRISNDGTPPSENLIEGEGIRGMRRKVQILNGHLSYNTNGGFCIEIVLPDV